MSPIFRFSILFLEQFILYLIYRLTAYMELSLFSQCLIVLNLFLFILFLEINGINHKLFNWLIKKFKSIKINQKFISLKEAIDYLIEYQVKHSKSGCSLLSMAEMQTIQTKNGYFEPKIIKKTVINQQYLADIFGYAQEGEITIYGQTQTTIKNLHPLKLTYIQTEPWFFKENWDDNYTSIYQQGKMLYTNLQIKKADLKQLVEKHKLSKEPVNL